MDELSYPKAAEIRPLLDMTISSQSNALMTATKVISGSSRAVWERRDGLVYITLSSDGTTGPQWVKRLAVRARVYPDAQRFLESRDFKPSPVGTVHHLVILPVTSFPNAECNMRAVWTIGCERGWHELNPEAMCLISENFTNDEIREMGFWWLVGLHETIQVCGNPRELFAMKVGSANSRLCLSWDSPGPAYKWRSGEGFVWSMTKPVS